jgi:hypothetical protein
LTRSKENSGKRIEDKDCVVYGRMWHICIH